MFGQITSGEESDIQHLTGIARHMVGRWGMSDAVGPVAVMPTEANGPLLPGASETSENTQQLVDSEVRRIVEEAQHDVTQLLTENRHLVEALRDALLERHELVGKEIAEVLEATAARGRTSDLTAPAEQPAL